MKHNVAIYSLPCGIEKNGCLSHTSGAGDV